MKCSRLRTFVSVILVTLFYTAVTFYKFDVYKTDLFHFFLGTIHEDYINVQWFLAWDFQHLLHGFSGYWDTPFYIPTTTTIGFGDHILGQSVLVLIPYVLTKSTVFSFNVLFILTFVLTGLAAYLLFVSITGYKTASLLMSFAFDFCQFRYSILAHTYVLSIYPIIFFFIFAHRFIKGGAKPVVFLWLAYLCLVWQILCGMNMGIYAYYIAFMFFVYYLWVEPSLRQKRVITQVLAGHFLTGLVLVWVALPNVIAIRAQEQAWQWGDIVRGSTYCGRFLSVPRTSFWARPWMELFYYRTDAALAFPGLFVLVALGAAWARWKPRMAVAANQVRWHVSASVALLIVSFCVGVASVAVFFLANPATMGIETEIKLSGWALLLALIALTLNLRWRSAVVQTFAKIPVDLRFYALLSVVTFLFSFSIFYRIPCVVLPGFNKVRVPARMLEYFQLGLCALGTWGFANLLSGIKSQPKKMVLTAVLVMMLFVENMHPNVPQDRAAPLPASHRWLMGRKDVSGIIELPYPAMWPDQKDYVYWTTFHWIRTVHGYSSLFPRYYFWLQVALKHHPLPPIDYLRALQVSHVICHWSRMDSSTRIRVKEGVMAAHLPLVFESEDSAIYRVPEAPSLELPLDVVPLPPESRLVTSVRSNKAFLAWDGNRQTSWKTGRGQKAGDSVEITLPRPMKTQGVVMWQGRQFMDFPRQIRVDGNINGQWVRLVDGSGLTPSAEDFRRVVKIPVDASTTLRWPSTECSAIKLTLTADAEENHWSIAELNLIPATGDR